MRRYFGTIGLLQLAPEPVHGKISGQNLRQKKELTFLINHALKGPQSK
jgi:hypothetical protein